MQHWQTTRFRVNLTRPRIMGIVNVTPDSFSDGGKWEGRAAPHGVRVNAVCPGNLLDGTLWQQSLYEQYARTQGLSPEEVRKKYESQVPLGRGCTYDDVCNVVTFLASDESSYMTGQAINVTGGQEMR